MASYLHPAVQKAWYSVENEDKTGQRPSSTLEEFKVILSYMSSRPSCGTGEPIQQASNGKEIFSEKYSAIDFMFVFVCLFV